MNNSVVLSSENNGVCEYGLMKAAGGVNVIQNGAQATIVLGDRLVATDILVFRDELNRLIEVGVTNLFLNCSLLSMMDAIGIGALVTAYNSLTCVDGRFVMTQVSAEIYDLLCSLRLERRFTVTRMNSVL